MLITVLGYVGDALSILALSMMFGLSRAVAKARPDLSRATIWALPALAVAIQLPLGAVARIWPTDPVEAGVVLGARSLIAALMALLHLGLAQKK